MVNIEDLYGMVLADSVTAPESVPPFDNTAVDGYAVRSGDVVSPPVTLKVIGELAAGAEPNIAVDPGTAVRIMTGAPIPEGCDAIVMVEDTERLSDIDGVLVKMSVPIGAGIRLAGSDITRGDVLFSAGVEVNAAMLGVLASCNVRGASAHRRPRVAVLSTGDELVDDGSPLRVGQIRESNRTMLLRLVAEAGCVAVDYGIIRDDENALERVLRDAADTCDAIVTSGGVSMGDYDVVKLVLSRIADMYWMQIAMKPAKPFAFGEISTGSKKVPVFGLPGNPVSSFVSFELLARPALRSMAGHPAVTAFRSYATVVLDDEIRRKSDGKVHFDRVFAYWHQDGRLHVRRGDAQASHQLSATAQTNALLEVPDGEGMKAGDTARALLFRPA
ncbi:MAG: hypothetical protein RL419_84 [Actinomycetota bacterium]